jgi:ADP-ribosylglycohydrolase
MTTSNTPDLDRLVANVRLYAQLKAENGADGVEDRLVRLETRLRAALGEIMDLEESEEMAGREPNDLPSIRARRPDPERNDRRLRDDALDEAEYRRRLEGALLARSAGCILGSPVEGWTIDEMRDWAQSTGDSFPPAGYWSSVPNPHRLRYQTTLRSRYTADGMDGIPVDDDLVYTALGLLILEEHGPDFTTDSVADAWLKYLPFACTAEDVTLTNLQRGYPAAEAGAVDGAPVLNVSCRMSQQIGAEETARLGNPYVQWIGADIRADPWGYVSPGNPERAAELAYRDAVLSHRRNGIYGAMFFAAAISAAFVVDDPMEALRIGLQEIPADCELARAIDWAFATVSGIRDYAQANAAVTERFPGMHHVHTINNACLTLFGLHIGGTDVSTVISQTVAMGYDNDCTAATAGSIVGAVVGKEGVPTHWTAKFNNTLHTFLKGAESFSIDDVVDRFTAQAALVGASS